MDRRKDDAGPGADDKLDGQDGKTSGDYEQGKPIGDTVPPPPPEPPVEDDSGR